MITPDPTNPDSHRRPARNSMFLIALIIAAAFVVAFQYTSYAVFPTNQTSMLWGVLTGLVIGGWIFGWLKKPWRDQH